MPADPTRLAIARQLLDQLGLSPTDLLSDGDHITTPPTVPSNWTLTASNALAVSSTTSKISLSVAG